jgi:prophage regulatory protein
MKKQIDPLLISFKEMSRLLGGISRSSIDRWESAGEFPKRIRIGENSVAWDFSQIQDWVKEKASNR